MSRQRATVSLKALAGDLRAKMPFLRVLPDEQDELEIGQRREQSACATFPRIRGAAAGRRPWRRGRGSRSPWRRRRRSEDCRKPPRRCRASCAAGRLRDRCRAGPTHARGRPAPVRRCRCAPRARPGRRAAARAEGPGRSAARRGRHGRRGSLRRARRARGGLHPWGWGKSSHAGSLMCLSRTCA